MPRQRGCRKDKNRAQTAAGNNDDVGLDRQRTDDGGRRLRGELRESSR